MTAPLPPPTPEERTLRAQRLAQSSGSVGNPDIANPLPPETGGIHGRTAGIPNMVWIGGAIVIGIVGLLWYFNRQNNQAATSSTTTTTDQTGQAVDTSGQFETIIAMLRDIQGNTSVPAPAPAPAVPPPPTPSPTPTGPPVVITPMPVSSNPGHNYRINTGDTLGAIAARNNMSEPQLYQNNKAVIEAAARAHGRQNSNGPNGTPGWWIYPGTNLVIT